MVIEPIAGFNPDLHQMWGTVNIIHRNLITQTSPHGPIQHPGAGWDKNKKS